MCKHKEKCISVTIDYKGGDIGFFTEHVKNFWNLQLEAEDYTIGNNTIFIYSTF